MTACNPATSTDFSGLFKDAFGPASCPLCYSLRPGAEPDESFHYQEALEAHDAAIEAIPNKICSNCGKDAALTCHACLHHDMSKPNTWYCNAECQKADWAQHKLICKERQAFRALHRTAMIVHELLLALRTVFHNFNYITFTEMKNEVTGTNNLIDQALEIVDDGACERVLSFPFPADKIPNDALKEAVLTLNGGFDSNCYLYCTWHHFLKSEICPLPRR